MRQHFIQIIIAKYIPAVDPKFHGMTKKASLATALFFACQNY